ncbi:MAG: hypothetical protein ACKERG_01185 [Candidatus Hodgkinia cicadicola]
MRTARWAAESSYRRFKRLMCTTLVKLFSKLLRFADVVTWSCGLPFN